MLLVTGYKGFIGSAFVRSYDGPWRGFDIGDIWDTSGVTKILHLAGIGGVTQGETNPHVYWERNVELSRAIFEVGLPVVYASSSSVYGHCIGPAREDRVLRPLSHYGRTKVIVEQLGHAHTGMRFFTVYGPGQREDMAFARWLTGEDVVVRDISSARDYTYIDDVVDAIHVLLDAPAGLYNVCSGTPVYMRQVLEILGFKYTVTRPLPIEPRITHGDNSKLRALGWAPKTQFHEGIRLTKASYGSDAVGV